MRSLVARLPALADQLLLALTLLPVLAYLETRIRTTDVRVLARACGLTLHQASPDEEQATPLRRVSSWQLQGRDARRYRVAVRVVEVWPFAPQRKCLRGTLAAGWLLRHRSPTLMIGVRRSAEGMVAHAWLAIDGMVFDEFASSYSIVAFGRGKR